jgi:hypothetical protein
MTQGSGQPSKPKSYIFAGQSRAIDIGAVKGCKLPLVRPFKVIDCLSSLGGLLQSRGQSHFGLSFPLCLWHPLLCTASRDALIFKEALYSEVVRVKIEREVRLTWTRRRMVAELCIEKKMKYIIFNTHLSGKPY